MIESALVFTLGALGAGLLALLVFPAFTRRAARLARREAEARLPRSLEEIGAEKDAIRADYAVRTAKAETEARAFAEAIVAERLAREDEASQLAAARAEVHALMSSLREVEDRLFAARDDLRERDEALARVAVERRDLERKFTAAFERARTAEGRLAQAERTLAALQQTAWARTASARSGAYGDRDAAADEEARAADVVDVDYREIRPEPAPEPEPRHAPDVAPDAARDAADVETDAPAPAVVPAPAVAPAPPAAPVIAAEAPAALPPVVHPDRVAVTLTAPDGADAPPVPVAPGDGAAPADWSGRIDEITGRIARFRDELAGPAPARPERTDA